MGGGSLLAVGDELSAADPAGAARALELADGAGESPLRCCLQLAERATSVSSEAK
jgi:hypothetical protein